MSAKLIVVGAGLAGLRAAYKAAEAGCDVTLICRLPGGRTASACAQGGINAALDNYSEGDTPWEHFCDTIKAGAYLADQGHVLKMCEAAPEIIEEMAANGALFNRLKSGAIDQRFLGGASKRRACFCGASTGQALVMAAENMSRYYEAKGKITRMEGFEFLSAALDNDGHCRGVVVQHVKSGEILGLHADAVVVASGGGSMIYGKSTNPVLSNGSAAAALYMQGAALANTEFVQFHPTAMLGDDKNRLISEAARGEGGRVYVHKDGKPWYFLEEMFPKWGNLITRDKASQAAYYVCNELGLGKGERYEVFLDISHLPENVLKNKLLSIIELYRKYGGKDPCSEPMSVFPGAHYFMGGLYVDKSHMTTIPGLFAAGECDYLYHGANRLGGNSLLSAIYSGGVTGMYAAEYAETKSGGESKRAIDDELKSQLAIDASLKKMAGEKNPYVMAQRFGTMLRENLFIVRFNEILEATGEIIQYYIDEWEQINVLDTGNTLNTSVIFARQLRCMMEYAGVMAKAALLRDESRGAHFKPDFSGRDDARFLKTSFAVIENGKPEISFIDVDTSKLAPEREGGREEWAKLY